MDNKVPVRLVGSFYSQCLLGIPLSESFLFGLPTNQLLTSFGLANSQLSAVKMPNLFVNCWPDCTSCQEFLVTCRCGGYTALCATICTTNETTYLKHCELISMNQIIFKYIYHPCLCSWPSPMQKRAVRRLTRRKSWKNSMSCLNL